MTVICPSPANCYMMSFCVAENIFAGKLGCTRRLLGLSGENTPITHVIIAVDIPKRKFLFYTLMVNKAILTV